MGFAFIGNNSFMIRLCSEMDRRSLEIVGGLDLHDSPAFHLPILFPPERRPPHLHPVLPEQAAELIERQHFVDRWSAVVLADLTEELLHLARWLINVDDPSRPTVR